MRYASAILLLLIVIDGWAAQATACKRIMWEPGRQYVIAAALNQSTHIILPERLATRPIPGNRELWNVDAAGSHVFIQPNSQEPAGASTTLTAITEADASYDFIVRRSNDAFDSCVQIVEGRLLDASQRDALNTVSSRWRADADALQKELQELRNNQQDAQLKAVAEAIRRYRHHIYTRYNWSRGGGFIGKGLISDVYDDGRFTYIRLHQDNKGLLVVEAQVSGKSEVVEAKYDDVAKIYQIVGIYPTFALKYDETRVEVKRDDNRTQGNY